MKNVREWIHDRTKGLKKDRTEVRKKRDRDIEMSRNELMVDNETSKKPRCFCHGMEEEKTSVLVLDEPTDECFVQNNNMTIFARADCKCIT